MKKDSKFNRWRKSWQTKSTLAIIITAAVLVGLTLALQYWFAYSEINTEIKGKAEKELEVKRLEIKNVMERVEVAADNYAWIIEQVLDTLDNDLYKRLSDNYLKNTPNVVGCGIAFEPGIHQDQTAEFPWLEFYVRKNDKGLCKNIGSKDHDYFEDDWYKNTMQARKGYWTEPYFDKEGAKMNICTYTHPIHNKDGKIVAVLGTDISLDWLSKMINDPNDKQGPINILLSKKGTVIACPVEKYEMKADIKDITADFEDKGVDDLNDAILKGKTGQATIVDNEGETKYVFYSPVHKDAGWSMAVVYSDSNIFMKLRRVSWFLFFVMILGMVLLAYILIRTIRGFNKLQEVNAEKAAIGNELKIASEIQKAMIPKIFPPYPERDDLDIFAQLTSAKEVGGDLFDFYIRDEKLFFCIGDVSGKGVPASLVMAVVKTQFRTASAHESKPERIVMAINNTMSEDNESCMFVTFFVGVLDLPTGRLRYCNAGHNAPLLVGKMVGTLPCDPNLPLGAMGGWKFTVQETTIDTDTFIFLYTDGLTEAENAQKEQFGDQRMVQTLKKKASTPDQMVKAITDDVHFFVGDAEQSDDITLLAIQYTKRHLDVKMQRSTMVTSDLKDVQKVTGFVEEVCRDVHFNEETSMQINLAIEEAVVNVMNYAYPKGTTGPINLMAQANESRLKFVISDKGKPFDPTAMKEIDTDITLDERQIGGLGIHLIRTIMDSINYERIDGENILTLRKNFTPDIINDN